MYNLLNTLFNFPEFFKHFTLNLLSFLPVPHPKPHLAFYIPVNPDVYPSSNHMHNRALTKVKRFERAFVYSVSIVM